MLTIENVLDELVRVNGIGSEITVREYFVSLLRTLWDQEDTFSGKRPFGDSGWKWDLISPIAERHPEVTDDEIKNILREALVTQF